MSLSILSSVPQSPEKVFSEVMQAVLNAKLFCSFSENSLKASGSIESINIRRYFGNNENEYEYFLMTIQETDWSKSVFEQAIFSKLGQAFYLLAGTDNTPSRLCYDFSLAYLKRCPDHLIGLYDWIFSLEDIQEIENKGGWYKNWEQDFERI